jgi:Late exocytosis, associated with Golgi transport/Cytosolic domain of 10TM putative phosphate transporter
MNSIARLLDYDGSTFSIWNYSYVIDSNVTDFDSNLVAAKDVSVDAVVTSLYFNSVIFILLMAFYECLRRLLPAVYSSRKKLDHVHMVMEEMQNRPHDHLDFHDMPWFRLQSDLSSLPDDKPLDWIGPVFGIPWSQVRKSAGLDGYFFLRYIRMCLRITAVSCFWIFWTLVPIYVTGGNPDQSSHGWYHISMANIPSTGWRIWTPCVVAYFFSAFVVFVIKQEFRHFLDLRQDFLARGTAHVNPQHHYSLKVENIPYELRSDRALSDYFDKLFPGKVHSASVVLNLPDLEEASSRCIRTCRRLEKSVAHLHATGVRPTHVVGRGRMTILGVDLQPLDINCANPDAVIDEEDVTAARPARGTRVDSISYYTQELAAHSRILFKMQKRKAEIAESGNRSMQADNWFDKVVKEASAMANRIMAESMLDNDLVVAPSSESWKDRLGIPQAEQMASRYGSFNPGGYLDDIDEDDVGVSPRRSTSSLDSKNERLVYTNHSVSARHGVSLVYLSEKKAFEL